MLLERQPDFAGYLAQQSYHSEVDRLREKYGPPEGRLYLARVDGAVAGSIALRKLDDGSCEVKRLYVRPAFRERGLARRLVKQILADAREIGYRRIYLDTFPFLWQAIRLYQSFGFYETESYNNTPMDSLIYLCLDLQ